MFDITLIAALLIATLIPAVAFFIIYRLDFYKTGTFRNILIYFAAGTLAYLLAVFANRTTLERELLSRMDIIRYSAPILEEIFKGALLLYIVRRANFTYFVEGAVYGFAIGVGFAIVENYEYILGSQYALGVAINRVLSTNLMHATTTSVLGIFLGMARFQPSLPLKLGYGFAGMAIAMLYHVAYNNAVSRIDPSIVLIIAIASGLIGAALIGWNIRRGMAEGRRKIEASLNMTDRVTAGETNAVARMDSIDELLKPVVEQFGKQKAEQMKDFMIIQARIGLLRNSLNLLTDQRMRTSIEQQIDKLRVEMDAARRKVGSYAMLYLRNTFPEGTSPLWNRLETVIQERASAPKPAGGANLWNILKSRQEDQKPPTSQSPQQETPNE
jgi:RsiW-degrading membrane proteinase PrsW (M82 family)